MKLLVLYKLNSEHSTMTESFVRDLRHQHDNINIETINAESKEGMALVDLYGVMDYPALIAVTDSGQMTNSWVGPQLPLMNEVAYYAQAS